MYIIIGASGFIGRHLYEYCKKNKLDVIGTYCSHSYDAEWVKFDLITDNLDEICHKYLNDMVPEAVILCSANASIDSCISNSEDSNKLNVESTRRVIDQINTIGSKAVFLSSEAVFDGEKGMYSEEDTPAPITLYGKQKLQIEEYMNTTLDNYLVFRISRAVGSSYGEHDIFDEYYNKILNQDEIVCLKDQSFCITAISDIVRAIIQAIEQDINGLYHLSSPNYISRYELARIYAKKMFGGYERISEKQYGEMHFLDNRHIHGGLKGDRLAGLIGIQYMSITEILDKYVDTYEITKCERKLL